MGAVSGSPAGKERAPTDLPKFLTEPAGRNPLLVRRGGREAAGVVGRTETWLVSDHPVCGAKVGFARFFFMPQPPLLTRRGISNLAQSETYESHT